MSNDSVGSIGRWEKTLRIILGSGVDVGPGQESITHESSASSSSDHALRTEMFSALSMNSAFVVA